MLASAQSTSACKPPCTPAHWYWLSISVRLVKSIEHLQASTSAHPSSLLSATHDTTSDFSIDSISHGFLPCAPQLPHTFYFLHTHTQAITAYSHPNPIHIKPLRRSQCLHIYSPTIHTHIHTKSLRKANAYVLSNPRYLTHCSTQNPSTFTKASFESFATSCHHNLQHLPQIRRKLLLTVPFHVERRSLGRFPRVFLAWEAVNFRFEQGRRRAFFSMPSSHPNLHGFQGIHSRRVL